MSLKKLSQEAILGLSLLGAQHAVGSIPTTDHLPDAPVAPEAVAAELGGGVFDPDDLKGTLFGDSVTGDSYDSFLLKLAAADAVAADTRALPTYEASGICPVAKTSLSAKGFGVPDGKPLVGYDVRLSASYKIPDGYSSLGCEWSGEFGSEGSCNHQYRANSAGDKAATFTVRYIKDNNRCSTSEKVAYKVREVRCNIGEIVGEPEIYGSGYDPVTGKQTFLQGRNIEIDSATPTGYQLKKCAWSGNLPEGESQTVNESDCRYDFTYPRRSGPNPDEEGYGKKYVILIATFINRNNYSIDCIRDHRYTVKFPAYRDDNDNGIHNWFEYWQDDNATPLLKIRASNIKHDKTLGIPAQFRPQDGIVYLSDGASKGIGYPKTINYYNSQYRLCSTTFIDAKTDGVDSVENMVAHEFKHKEVFDNWRNGTWNHLSDSDGDQLPDTYELEAYIDANPNNVDTCGLGALFFRAVGNSGGYEQYGDEEVLARIAGDGKRGIPDNDYAERRSDRQPSLRSQYVPMDAGDPIERDSGPVDAGSQPPSIGGIRNTSGELASIIGNYADTGLDTDGDGKYNVLDVSFDIQVVDPLRYSITGWLRDSNYNNIAWARTSLELAAGVQTVSLQFDGAAIQASGRSGPYTVSVIELNSGEIDIGPTESLTNAYETTPSYSFDDFDPPAVAFSTGFTDSAIDNRDNDPGMTLYDLLRVNVNLNVDKPGTYTVIGELQDITSAVTRQFEAGSHMISLDFEGSQIFRSRQDPYSIERLRVEDASGNRVSPIIDPYQMTTWYDYREFDHRNIAIYTSDTDGEGVDFNGDGYFDTLQVKIILDSSYLHLYGGTYDSRHLHLSAALEDKDGNVIATADDYIGISDLVNNDQLDHILNFPGSAIHGSQANGPYRVSRIMLLGQEGEIYDYLKSGPITQNYAYTDFGPPLPDNNDADVNEDSAVNALDVVAVINHFLGLQTWPKADVNNDSAVNALDVVLVINRVLGI